MALSRTMTLPLPLPVRSLAIELQSFALDVVDGPEAGRTITAHARSVVVGSHPSADLVLTDPYVSRLHARIDASPGGYVVRDLGSSNGTRAGGVWLHEARLVDRDDLVVIG